MLDIITCPEWEARPPKQEPQWTGKRATSIIFHHTAGHHQEIDTPGSESLLEAIRYAQLIQNYHMDHNGWNDSGHNFLVTRAGRVLQGRWRTVRAIEEHNMVVSAHCPGQNDQIGIEHEHYGMEPMTPAQFQASARLQAWIAWQYDLKTVLPVFPHRKFFATTCPANLVNDIAGIRQAAQAYLASGC